MKRIAILFILLIAFIVAYQSGLLCAEKSCETPVQIHG